MELIGTKIKEAIKDAREKLTVYNDNQTIINSRRLWESIRIIEKEADILEKKAIDFREQEKRANEKLKAVQRDIE